MLVKHGKSEVPNSFLTHCCIQFSQQAVVKNYIAYVVALLLQNMKRDNADIEMLNRALSYLKIRKLERRKEGFYLGSNMYVKIIYENKISLIFFLCYIL